MSRAVLDNLIRETPGLWRGRDHEEIQSREAPPLASEPPTGLAAVPASSADPTVENPVPRHVFDTGYPALNDLLPTGGWPRRAIIEIVVPAWGSGELQPLLPLMARLTAAGVQVALVAPPFQPYAPALIQAGIDLANLLVVAPADGANGDKDEADRNAWWAAEKLLRQGDAALVLLWPGAAVRERAKRVRRLQLAADRAGGVGVILGCGPVVDSPVGLRLQVERGWTGWGSTCRERESPWYGSPADIPVRVSLTKSRYGWCHGETIELTHGNP